MALSATASKAQPFLPSQAFRLLLEREDPWPHLTLQAIKTQTGPWWSIERHCLGELAITAPQYPCPTVNGPEQDPYRVPASERVMADYSLRRVVLTGDGGTGKSANVAWLAKHFCSEVAGARTGFVIDLAQVHGETIVELLAKLYVRRLGKQPTLRPQDDILASSRGPMSSDAPQLLDWLKRSRDRGTIDLLLDGLDQVSKNSSGFKLLAELVADPAWHACRLFISGRPYSIQGARKDIFEQSQIAWQFVVVDEYSDQQQQVLLGQEKWSAVPMEARSLLKNPRALDYIRRRLTISDLQSLRNASELFVIATEHMLREGMANSAAARRLGQTGDTVPDVPQQASLEQARKLLAHLAFQMTFGKRLEQSADGETPDAPPNFQSIEPGVPFEEFVKLLSKRMEMSSTDSDRRLLRRDLDALSALNTWLQQGFLDGSDSNVEGLNQILWRDRTMQEFWAAVYLCRWCSAQDLAHIGDWLYLPYVTDSDEFKMIWQFLCEMPDRSPNYYFNVKSWLLAIAPLYQPGDGTIAGTRRSTEMLYRSWHRLEKLAVSGDSRARRMIAMFQSEFEQILGGNDERAHAAQEFVEGFIEVPAEIPFRMGTPLEKQGMPASGRAWYMSWLNNTNATPESFISANSHWFAPGKAGDRHRDSVHRVLSEFRERRNIAVVENAWYTKDETPAADWVEPEVAAFQLHKYPTLRAWYWLFDPGHGQRDEWYASTLDRAAPTGDYPVFYVSWYDAWVFCKFAYWDGQSCRLPHEDEWEKAAKAARCIEDCDWNYWWGDRDKPEHRTADKPYDSGHSTCPRDYAGVPEGQGHKNWLGFVDILGNQWEWTEDEYRRCYSRNTPPDSTSRVARGGSWYVNPAIVRSSVRPNGHPAVLSNNIGFRVARALLKL